MKRIKPLMVLLLLVIASTANNPSGANLREKPAHPADKIIMTIEGNPEELPGKELLQTALVGYELLKQEQPIRRQDVITIIDYSLPSNQKRLWVLDLTEAKVLVHCLVSHGRNSGDVMAEKFSNHPGSYASSPGFYITGETYQGKHGLSLRLQGVEDGINDKARERAIVIHGADYVSDRFIEQNGRLGRSLGCPAVPQELSGELIENIRDGSCLFVYTPSESYLSKSPVLTRISRQHHDESQFMDARF